MPPKKPGGPKGKKGKKGKKGDDADEAFQRYLDDTFFVAPKAREQMKLECQKTVRDVFSLFQGEREGLCPSSDLGTICRALGFEPTVAQLRIMVPLVDDGQTGDHLVYEKLQHVLSELMIAKELKFAVTTPDGQLEKRSELIHREPEHVLVQAFETLWRLSGDKRDPDGTRVLDGEQLGDHLSKLGPEGERFNEEEKKDFLANVADPDTKLIKEDTFALALMPTVDV